MPDIQNQDELDGWVIESRRSRYSIGYWLLYVVGLFGQFLPTPPDISYTVRNKATGQRRAFELPGDHSRADLSAILAKDPSSERPAGEGSRNA